MDTNTLFILIAVFVFGATYLLNVITITVGYHRGLAHNAVHLRPWLHRAIVLGGNWITGLDPKAWVVMHRLHHAHSDTPQDPHSPENVGLFGVPAEQLRNYKRVLKGLFKKDPYYTTYATDLDFPVNFLNRRGLWYLPYLAHAAISLLIGVLTGAWIISLAYFVGMMSHPVQGSLVNGLGHAIGGRNFETPDNSRNNPFAAWLIFGEGFQNNHHHRPTSARFSYQPYEIDLGYGACVIMEQLGMLQIRRDRLLPRAIASAAEAKR